jgi:hypothetical protein
MAKPSTVLLAVAALLCGAMAACTRTTDDYPLRSGVTATVFWVGEPATADNDQIANAASYWDRDWEDHFGGFDDPERRAGDGRRPAAFEPAENAFYFALPYGEFDGDGKVKDLTVVPWYDGQPVARDRSILKNRWIEVTAGDRTAYAQWQDVGPFNETDPDYVFGDADPEEPRAGLDLSPATAAAIGVDGRGEVSWRFVRAADVPDGPWTRTVTTRGGIPETETE